MQSYLLIDKMKTETVVFKKHSEWVHFKFVHVSYIYI